MQYDFDLTHLYVCVVFMLVLCYDILVIDGHFR